MRILALLLILSSNSLISQEIKKIDSGKSKISYSGNHFLHKWSADNQNISGLIKIDDGLILNIGIVAKVTDFKSGNSSLDSNSYRVLEALTFPNIIFKSSEIQKINEQITINGLIEFHGIEKSIKISADLAQTSNSNRLDGEFNINLSDFSIERPSLLLKKIDDQIKISFTLVFN